jgi:DNA-binding transcriptional regulator LsrR (DeoR family)
LERLQEQGAAGDILLHFFDQKGDPIDSELNKRVIAMSLEQLRDVNQAIGLAGGKRKYKAILGALWGGWINILITDHFTATQLLDE